MYASKSTRGFYDAAIHGDNMPADVVEITAEEHAALLDGQSAGLVIAWGDDGAPFLQQPPPPTTEQLITQYRDAVQAHLDGAAKTAGYDDIKTAVTYAEEPAVPKFQVEGQAFRAWRSLVWQYGYAQLDAILAGERERPPVGEFIAELPALVLPA